MPPSLAARMAGLHVEARSSVPMTAASSRQYQKSTPYKSRQTAPKFKGEHELSAEGPSMKLSPHYLKRYKDIALLFAKYGQPGMISKFGFETAPDRLAGNGHHDEQDLPNDLERRGPTFVKIGQL